MPPQTGIRLGPLALLAIVIFVALAACGTPPQPVGAPSADGAGDTNQSGNGAPVVTRSPAYRVTVSTRTYAKALRSSAWGHADASTVDLLLDLYEPVGAPANRPAMILIHGGGFRVGSRRQSALTEFAYAFAARGWVCASIDYRLVADHGTVPAQWEALTASALPNGPRDQGYAMYPAARDAKAAARWLHANAVNLGVNPDYITVLGGSAGALLAVMIGTTDPADYRDEVSLAVDPTLATTNLTARSDVQSVVDFWGSGILVRALEKIDGCSRFDANDASILIVHGTEDATVPFAEAQALRAAYADAGVPFEFVPLTGEAHSAWDAQVRGANLREVTFRFVTGTQRLVVK